MRHVDCNDAEQTRSPGHIKGEKIKMKTGMYKKKTLLQRGFSFIELIIVLAIVAAAGAALMALGNSTKSSSGVTDASQEIAQVAAAGQAAYSYSRGDYTGISAAQLAGSAKVPDTMKSGTTLVNTFGETITVAVGGATAALKKTFVISYIAPDAETCSDIASLNIGKYDSIKTGTTVITTLATAQTACATSQTILVGVK